MRVNYALALLCLSILGCATTKTRIQSAPPPPSCSIGLFLVAEAAKDNKTIVQGSFFNVSLYIWNNTPITLHFAPRITFYAEQSGQYFPLRVIENVPGVIPMRPYSLLHYVNTLNLPRPPRAGRWNVFAMQEHSARVFHESEYYRDKLHAIYFIEDKHDNSEAMWTNTIVSNSIIIDFPDFGEYDQGYNEDFIKLLIDAGQYKLEFRKPQGDPRIGCAQSPVLTPIARPTVP